MECACLRDDGLDCAQARYGRHADEPCECSCHYPEPEGWEERHFYDLSGQLPLDWSPSDVVFLPGERVKRKG
jgi:hypothetical protein